MKRCWVTGGRGFIGRHMGRLATSRGYVVGGVGHGLWPDVEREAWGFASWVNGDVDTGNLNNLLRIAGEPEIIFHMAGGSSVGESFRSPLEDYHRSVDTTAQLLEWCRTELPAARIVAISSGAVYGAGYTGRIGSHAAPAPLSPYGVHKLMMERLCHSYADHFGIRVRIMRLFSVYGPGLGKQLFWDVCSRLSRGERPVTLGGTGDEIRDWIHVDDVVRILWEAALDTGTLPPVVNVGTGVPTTVRDAVRLVCESWGDGAHCVFDGAARAGDPFSLVADTSALDELRCTIDIPFETGIIPTVQAYRAALAR